MSIIGWLVLGLIAGFIASKIVNKTGEGVILDIVLGIIGAVVGGFLFSLIGAEGVTGFNIYSMFVAIIGAIVVLLIYHAVSGRRGVWTYCPPEGQRRTVSKMRTSREQHETSTHPIPRAVAEYTARRALFTE
jgi:uncharacterized membrane protein YeaQ/YmgE (transglycosylase-associated protein family)